MTAFDAFVAYPVEGPVDESARADCGPADEDGPCG